MKRSLIVVLLTFCLTATLSMIIPIESRVGYYDPWLDINDDGNIDMKDVAAVAKAYGSVGEPINKTALLLEIQDRLDNLEDMVQALEKKVVVEYQKKLKFWTRDLTNEVACHSTVWTPMPDTWFYIQPKVPCVLLILFTIEVRCNDDRLDCADTVLVRIKVGDEYAEPSEYKLTPGHYDLESTDGIWEAVRTVHYIHFEGSGADSMKVSVEWRNLVDGDVWAVAYERCLTVIKIP